MPLALTEDKAILEAPDEETNQEVLNEAETKSLLFLAKEAEKEDEEVRFAMLQKCKRNNYYFNNLQKFFWDDVARDYRSIDSAVGDMLNATVIDDIKTVNIFRAFLESIIAALSVEEPNILYPPDDADDPDDIETSEAYSKISELIKKHTKSKLMLIKALTLFNLSGFIASYNYRKEDPSYGVVRGNPTKFENKPQTQTDVRCPQCGELYHSEMGELAPQMPIQCQSCGFQGPGKVIPKIVYFEEPTEWEDTPKSRVGFDIFDQTHVKVSLSARNQESVGYVILRLEEDVAKLKTIFEDDEIETGGADTYLFERWARIPPEYYGTIPKNLTTLRTFWIRPWFFRKLKVEDYQPLLDKYPNGVRFDVIGDKIYGEPVDEKLDKRWTFSFDPRSNNIHAEANANAIIPIQDAENDVFNIGLQTLQHGMSETFVHPKTLNIEKYSKTRAAPGNVTQALPPGPDKNLADGFFSLSTATLSNEHSVFDEAVNAKGQFISAAMPSIWGGTAQGGSDTATEAQQNKAQALQRLQLTWEIISSLWATLMGKCVREYADNLLEDEHFPERKNGSFVNVWIRKSSLAGKVGEIEPELNGSIPQSWSQKRDFLMKLIELGTDEVTAIVLDPNNTELVKQVTGMTDLYIPGEKDRNKQWAEFYRTLQGEQVPIDVDVDDHMVHQQVLKNILVSPVGMNLEPNIYQINIEHYRQHELALQAKTMEKAGGTDVNQLPDSSTASTQS